MSRKFMLKSCSIHLGIPASCRMRPSSSLASTWITVQRKPRRGSTEKESDGPHLAEKTLNLGAALENIRPHGHVVRGVAVRGGLRCWTFWSRLTVTHVQGTIS